MSFTYYLHKAIRLPPSSVLKKSIGRVERALEDRRKRRRDKKGSSYTVQSMPFEELSTREFHPLHADLSCLSEGILWLSSQYLEHRFDVLGSDWVRVRHGMECPGLEGVRYDPEPTVAADPEGRWLEDRINPTNLEESKKIWSRVDKDYIPMDWHIDFRSGFRWKESIHYHKVRASTPRGADLKVPWELARMHHLTQHSFAYLLSKEGEKGFSPPHTYLREFRNQVLDFAATNPPCFGVNWACTMDVAIRAANWLVAYDLFRGGGAAFDPDFENLFTRFLYDHGRHIMDNLEWSEAFSGNHYLSNIAGLIFVAAFLPRTGETDAWLAFGVQELIGSVESQFQSDGSNFEASTSYHRLSAEMVTFATARILGLPLDKVEALREYDHGLHSALPELGPAPIKYYKHAGESTPFPPVYLERVQKMAAFSLDAMGPDGRAVQIGDNDSGRFLKVQPAMQGEAPSTRSSKKGSPEAPPAKWKEDVLDHRHLSAAAAGLFSSCPFEETAKDFFLETAVVRMLARNRRLPSLGQAGKRQGGKDHSGNASSSPCCPVPFTPRAYPDFGLYLFQSERIRLALRCGPVGRNGTGGHGHNDQLSFELALDGRSVVVDPGTYLYTSSPRQRDLFRSTKMHNTLFLEGKEQNRRPPGQEGLFVLYEDARSRVIRAKPAVFEGVHFGFGGKTTRLMEMMEDGMTCLDRCDCPGDKGISFHLAPGRKPSIHSNGTVVVTDDEGNALMRLVGGPGAWSLEEGAYSPGYGLKESACVVRLYTDSNEIHWQVALP